MPDHQRITSPAQATRAARAALGAVGLADVRRVTSRTVTEGGRLYGTIRTDVYLAAHHDRGAIADLLRTLPGTVAVDTEENHVYAYRAAAAEASADTP
ncbi:hypothetical protein [Micromonospora sp. NBC_00860]|uniref:hypothetical protein n=1 Tax=Micromonospora sp. NBC_00860 TaxID=2975980 RepID=UPI003863DC83|nr:hypothetical protein OH804_04405 [Micromonospora sp. NBC_00860]